MANHPSAIKRIRSSAKKRTQNHYQIKSAKTAVKKILLEKNKADIEKQMGKVVSMLDKLVKKNQIHLNKANRQKARIMRHANQLKA